MSEKIFENILKLLFHPMTFAIGFIAPLSSQTLVSLNLMNSGFPAMLTGLAVGLAFGLMAIYRGSWIWIR